MELQVGVRIFLKNKDGKYLAMLRSAEKYPEAGAKWEMVGGRINPGTPLIENIKREVMEETGLEITGEPELVTAQDILRPHKHIVRLTYSGFADGEVKLSEEHTEYKWLTKNEILKLEPLDKYFREVLEKFYEK
ncbi:MAG: MutT related protein [Parcubacteria group bacterium GW2011_GWF2_38_8]|nr:MAG: MutT related protein [Parcubacteria group bacterium GW2011_GWF2_38_8]